MKDKLAEFYRCALQVNTYDYIKYRGQEHAFSEKEYNNAILKNCIEKNIKVVGLADHGDISKQQNLKKLLEKNDITVFQGFEVASSEKIHIVCLFKENESQDNIIKCLGKIDVQESLSKKTALDIVDIVQETFGGFCYLAHITEDNGILKKGQMNHIWTSQSIKAAQIESSIENVPSNYKNIINNTEPQYKRDKEMAFINAKDVCKPDDLLIPESMCLIKMSNPSLNSLKIAFLDAKSRVKLTSDLNENYYTFIENIKVFGGYLDNLDINISSHLNTVIGGRGTGKSTLLELIRYALDIKITNKKTKDDIDNLLKSNLGIGSRIEITISTNKYQGKKYKIIRRYLEEPTIIDLESGTISNLNITDLIPKVEIYGQNEILELTKDEDEKYKILERFIPNNYEYYQEKENIISKINENTKELVDLYTKKDNNDSDINQLPTLKEQLDFYKTLEIEKIAGKIGKNTKEKTRIDNIINSINQDNININDLESNIDEQFLNEINNKTELEEIDKLVKKYNSYIDSTIKEIQAKKEKLLEDINYINKSLEEKYINDNNEVNDLIKSNPKLHGKDPKDILVEYTNTIKRIEEIQPKDDINKKIKEDIQNKEKIRKELLEKLAQNRDNYDDKIRKLVKKVNSKKLKDKVRINILHRKNRSDLKNYLASKDGIGEKSLEWIDNIDDFSINTFIKNIILGKEALLKEYKKFGLTDGKAEKFEKFSKEDIFNMEIIELKDIIDIQLYIQSSGEYKSLNKLSKGQQCTAILYILLLENEDPLIVDQPEDNLDNSFISDDFIDVLRENKMKRQFIFATHNANIPVFGDAECIAVMEEYNGTGIVKDENIGSIDDNCVCNNVINILEGGKDAFKMRKEKYGI